MEDIQDRFFSLRNTALDPLVDLINDIKTARQNGVTDAQQAAARDYHRRGQFMIDKVARRPVPLEHSEPHQQARSPDHDG